MYANELKYMMDLDSGLARTMFSGMLKTYNFVIVETIALSNFCPLMNLCMHLGFDVNDIRTYGINLAIYNDSNNTMIRSISGSVRNVFDGFMLKTI